MGKKGLYRKRKSKGRKGNSEASDAYPGETTNANVLQHPQQQEESDASQPVPFTSSSADPESGHEFEVFLSFRGSDNRKKFTDNLYHRLIDAGVRTFRDNEELRFGAEISPKLMKSIKQSKIAIPIFSKDYASSKWCLEEFGEMVKCMKDIKLQIMPIFLDVTPDEVQHQTGSYADSFTRHEKRFGSDIVQEWRKALQEVMKLKGLELNSVANGYEGVFIKFIVAKVIRDLKKSHLKVNNILVGIDDRAEDLIKKLEVGIDDIRVVGVWGMGGIGKTTLAKFVYNQVVDEFPSNSFLNNIRETSRNPRGLQKLQSKLASDILRLEEKEYADIGDGIKVLEERLRDKKALILLDDVDRIAQLNALAKDLRWFGRGSRIIITTREKKVLDQFQKQILALFQNEVPDQFRVQDPYEVALLDKDQAFELFCQHAFRDKLPRTGFVDQAWEVVNITGGLPLALEVIGSFLSDYGGRKGKPIWKSTVDKLKEMPHEDVQAVLKISYDSLDGTEKDIFLDIACFFIGMDVRIVKSMWLDCKFHPEVGIEILKLKALIKIREDNTIWMHDQLRDLGRDVVKQENNKEPGRRSRVWHNEDAVKVLLGQGTSKVEAIRLEGDHLQEHADCLDEEMFRNLSSLRVLELDRVRLDENFQHTFRWLRWLRWRGENISPLKNLILKNLLVLDLSWSRINDENFLGWSSEKMGMKLKVLNLGKGQIKRTPCFSEFPNLEILILAYCNNLIWVDPSIGLLKNLILLDVRGCWNLRKLPQELGKVESLVELLIDWTKVRKLPISSGMKKLEILSTCNCTKLEELPGNLGSLKKLKVLDASGNWKLHDVEISDEFLSLSSLKVLKLRGVKSLPSNMSSLSCLQTLHIGHSPDLQRLPELPSKLLSLDVEASSKLISLNLTNLANLKELRLYGEFKLEGECFSSLKKLEKMSLSYIQIQIGVSSSFNNLERSPDFGNLVSLKELGIYRCSLNKLPDLSKLKNLERLAAQYCPELADIQGLGSLGNCLKVLDLRGCEKLSQVEAIGELESVRDLNLSKCTGLRKLPNLSKLQRLKKIDMSDGVDIDGFPAVLGGLGNLESLDLCESRALIAKLGDKMKALNWYQDYISHISNEDDDEARDLLDRGIITKADEDAIRKALASSSDNRLTRELEINGKPVSIYL